MGLVSDNVEDVATASNFKEVKTTYTHLELKVNFDEKQIIGAVDLSLLSLQDGLTTVSLDAHKTLFIKQVKEHGNETRNQFSIKPFADYGTHLIIELTSSKAKGENFVLNIEFVATNGPGVCWLDPPQTAGRVKPFMYTQGQSVLNRSFFPCQDTPAVKAPYSASVQVPPGFTAVMSANVRSFGEKPNKAGDRNCYYFEQTVPIVAYLVALAVGDLQSAQVGPRSQVWAEPVMLGMSSEEMLVDTTNMMRNTPAYKEPEVVLRNSFALAPSLGGSSHLPTFLDGPHVDVICDSSKAQAEFDGVVEDFIQTGEKLFGEYVWGCYDILIMPPSFPYGGMENPCLTFVTPCIVVGDKSLTDVVIHEITHSWFGNLVTNANWSEFWLNEGFTMFGQRRIEEKLYGKAAMCLEAETGQSLLRRHLEQEGDSPLTRLRVIIEKGVDPDDTYNETPYEKGFIFVCYLRSLVGDDDKFDEFLKEYVKTFKYKSIVAEDLFEFYLDYFPHLREAKVHEKPGFEFVKTWLNTPGWPSYSPDLSAHKELTEPAEAAAQLFITNATGEVPDVKTWGAYQLIYFLDRLAEKSPLPPEAVQRLINEYPFLSTSQNAEIKQRWCEIVIKNDIQEKFDDIRAFLHSQGKQKYTKPLYQAMVRGSEAAKKFATEVFEETKTYLHINVRDYVIEILEKGGCIG